MILKHSAWRSGSRLRPTFTRVRNNRPPRIGAVVCNVWQTIHGHAVAFAISCFRQAMGLVTQYFGVSFGCFQSSSFTR